jgi:F-type H+-transporting ATPase subunit b
MPTRLLATLIFALVATVTLRTAPPAFAADTGGNVTTSKTTEAGATDGHAGGSKSLMPDMSKRSSWYSALWVMIIFLIMLAILYPTAWKNVLNGLKAREQRIRHDIAEAEAARTRAEATLRDYNTQLATAEQKVRDLIATATADGERVAAQIRARGEQEAQEAKERAMKEIEGARKQAVSDIYDQAATLATTVAEKILRRELNPNDQRDLVNRSLDQVQNLSN